jgi:hypothetical protein
MDRDNNAGDAVEPDLHHGTAYTMGVVNSEFRFLVETNWFLAVVDEDFPLCIRRKRDEWLSLLESVPACSEGDPVVAQAKDELVSTETQLEREWMGPEHREQIRRRESTDAEGKSALYGCNVASSQGSLDAMDATMGEIAATQSASMELCFLVGQALTDVLFAPPSVWKKVHDLEAMIREMLPRLQDLFTTLAGKLLHIEQAKLKILSIRPTHVSANSVYHVLEQLASIRNELTSVVFDCRIAEIECVRGHLGLSFCTSGTALTVRREGHQYPVEIRGGLARELFRRLFREGTSYCDNERLLGAWRAVGRDAPSGNTILNWQLSALGSTLLPIRIEVETDYGIGRRLVAIESPEGST